MKWFQQEAKSHTIHFRHADEERCLCLGCQRQLGSGKQCCCCCAENAGLYGLRCGLMVSVDGLTDENVDEMPNGWTKTPEDEVQGRSVDQKRCNYLNRDITLPRMPKQRRPGLQRVTRRSHIPTHLNCLRRRGRMIASHSVGVGGCATWTMTNQMSTFKQWGLF